MLESGRQNLRFPAVLCFLALVIVYSWSLTMHSSLFQLMYSWFSLFMVARIYNIAVNIQSPIAVVLSLWVTIPLGEGA